MQKYPFMFFLFAFLILQSSSCNDPIDPVDPMYPNITKTKLKFVWIKPIYQDTSCIFQSDLYFSGDYIAVGALGYMPEHKDKGMAVFNRYTGQRHPHWNREPCCILEGNASEFEDFAIGGVQNDLAFFSESRYLYAYDVTSGQKKWSFHFPTYMPSDQFTTFGDKVYLPYWAGYTWSTTWAKLARYDSQTGSQEDLFTVSAVQGYDFYISPPVGYVQSNNDTLVIGVTYHYNFANHAKLGWAYCYNVTQKTMKWENKTFSNDNENSRNKPQIMDNGKVLIHTMRGIYCLNIEDGSIVWRKEGLCLSLNRTYLLYDNGKVYCRLDDGMIQCWDAQTGIELWKNEKNKFEIVEKENIVCYNEKLYFCSYDSGTNGVLNCISAETGKFLWSDPGLDGKMNGRLLLDKNLGYLYGYVYGFIYCIDLKEIHFHL